MSKSASPSKATRPRDIAIESLRDQLIQRRRLLTRVLRDDLNGLGEYHIARNSDVLDAAADTISDAVNTGLIRSENQELAAINEALDRIELGCYGRCVQCEKNIPLSRLRAVPYADACIECRRRAESVAASPMRLWSQASTASVTGLA